MNAISPIRVDETVAERAHRHSISIHLPNCDEMEMAARCDLAAMRDAAGVGMSRASSGAAAILQEVARSATDVIYAPIPCSKLLRIRAALNLAMMAARDLEQAHRDG